MKEYQYLIGKIIAAVAIIVAAIIIAQAIGGAGESIRSGLFQLGDLWLCWEINKLNIYHENRFGCEKSDRFFCF